MRRSIVAIRASSVRSDSVPEETGAAATAQHAPLVVPALGQAGAQRVPLVGERAQALAELLGLTAPVGLAVIDGLLRRARASP